MLPGAWDELAVPVRVFLQPDPNGGVGGQGHDGMFGNVTALNGLALIEAQVLRSPLQQRILLRSKHVERSVIEQDHHDQAE